MSDRPHRPELRVLGVLCALGVAVSSGAPHVLGGLGLAPLASMLRGAARRARLTRRFASVVPLAIACAATRAACVQGATSVSLLGLATSREALAAGGLMLLRIVVAVLWTSWLAEAVAPRDMDRALRRLGVPAALVELIALTRRFAAQLRGTLASAWTAAALRGGLTSARTATRTSGLLAGVVLLRALDRSDRVALALALRGHGGAAADCEPEPGLAKVWP